MSKLQIKKAFRIIVLDFPRTVKPDSFRDEILIPFFKNHLVKYLKSKWGEIGLTDIVRQLRFETESLRRDNSSCPAVAPASSPKDDIIRSVHSSAMWHLKEDNMSPAMLRLMSAVWIEGYRKHQIKTEIYPDVQEAFEYWKTFGIKIYTLSSSPVYEQKIILTHSKYGKLDEFIDEFLDSTAGSKHSAETYRKIARNADTEPSKILFITDYDVYARAASDADFRVILLVRDQSAPQNLEFISVSSFADISFSISSHPAFGTV